MLCEKLTSINVDESNNNYSSQDGVLFNKGKTVLITCPQGKAEVYSIPDGVTRIDRSAFFCCFNLSSITIPNNVTSIGDDAFTYCNSLESISIPCNFNKTKLTGSGITLSGNQYTIAPHNNTGTFTYIHAWSYSASGAAVTAACGHVGCVKEYDETGITLTLNAPEDLTWSGSAKKATISGYPTTAPNGLDTKPTIIYYYKSTGTGSTETNGNALSGAPSEIGNYVAQTTWGGKTASLAFTIAAREIVGSVTSYTGVYDGNTFYPEVVVADPENGYTMRFLVTGNSTWSSEDAWTEVFSDFTDATDVTLYTYNRNCSTPSTISKAADSPVYVFVELSAENYATCVLEATVTISKSDQPATITNSAAVTLGGNTVDLSGKVNCKTDYTGGITYQIESDNAGGDCTVDSDTGVFTSGSSNGTCTVAVTVTGDNNYTKKTGTITVTVTDKKAADLEVTQANAVYGEKLADPSWTRPAKPVKDAVVSYSGTTAAGAAYGPDSKKPTEVGSYTVSVTEETMDTIFSGSVAFTISKSPDPASITGTASVAAGGNTVDLSKNVTDAIGTVSFAFDGDANGCTLDKQGVLTSGSKTGTCKVKVTIAESENHTGKTDTITVTVTDKKTAQLKVTQADAVYDEKLADPSWTRPSKPVKDAVVSYSGTTEAGAAYGPDSKKPTEAGSYTVSVTEETSDTVYTGSAEFTIFKAEPKVTAPKAKEGLVENGKAQELVAAGSADGGEMQYAIGKDGKTAPTSGWGKAVPKGTDAGTYYVWYRVTGDANHLDGKPACVTVTIEKKPEPEPEPKPEKKEKVTLKKIRISKTESLSNHKIRVSWKKLDKAARKKAKMIEIQVCPDEKFEKNVITKKVKSTETSVVIKNLVKGKRYYIRIRVYTQKGNIKYVSKWSKPKTFRIIKSFKK